MSDKPLYGKSIPELYGQLTDINNALRNICVDFGVSMDDLHYLTGDAHQTKEPCRCGCHDRRFGKCCPDMEPERSHMGCQGWEPPCEEHRIGRKPSDAVEAKIKELLTKRSQASWGGLVTESELRELVELAKRTA